MPALLVAREPVLGDRLPGGGVTDELPDAGPYARVLVEGSHPDADWIGVREVAAEQGRPALAAEPLLAAALRLPDAQRALAREDPQAGIGGMRLD